MKRCPQCGAALTDTAVTCDLCNADVVDMHIHIPNPHVAAQQAFLRDIVRTWKQQYDAAYKILVMAYVASVSIPIVGAIVYLVGAHMLQRLEQAALLNGIDPSVVEQYRSYKKRTALWWTVFGVCLVLAGFTLLFYFLVGPSTSPYDTFGRTVRQHSPLFLTFLGVVAVIAFYMAKTESNPLTRFLDG
jgi:hypothetical protein